MLQTKNSTRRAARTLAVLTTGALALVACGSSPSSSSSPSVLLAPKVVVTSVKDDPRSQLLAAIYARLLQEAGLRVSRKDPVAMDRAQYLDALANGEFQLIPDFTGDLLHHVYSQPGAPSEPTTVVPDAPASTQAPVTIPPTTVPDTGASTTTSVAGSTTTEVTITNGRTVAEQLVAIRAVLPDSITVGNPALAEVKTVIACTDATMTAHKDTQFVSFNALASAAPTVRLAGSAEWMADTEFGYPAFQQYYGGDFKAVVTVADADLEKAVTDDSADCFALDSMNPLITTKNLTILTDDKSMVKGNAAVPLIATNVATTGAIDGLDKVSTALTSARLNQMLNQVNGGTDPVTVANAFLDTLGSTTG